MADENVPAVFKSGQQSLTIRYIPSEILMHTLSGEQLDTIASTGLSNSVNVAFFGIAAGALISFTSVLLTVSISDAKTYAAFMGLAWISGFLSLFLGVRSALDYKKAKAKLKEIKGGLSKPG